jgi:3-oxoacyl-[acyl-carrier protein] reductase
MVHGRDSEALSRVKRQIHEETGHEVKSVVGDVTRATDLNDMRLQLEAELGPADILVVNAGGSFTRPGPFEDIDEESWRASVDGNLTSTFLTLKTFIPGMKERRKGVIFTLSSVAGHRPHPNSPIPYAAAKAGIEMITKDLAMQAGPFGIRVNCIAPETIMTERNAEQIPEELQRTLAGMHPLKRLGSSEDVAEAAVFLASDASGWITGIVLDIAGGGQPS